MFNGFGFNCALNVLGELRCWGRNDRGQLGQGECTDSHGLDGHGLGVLLFHGMTYVHAIIQRACLPCP